MGGVKLIVKIILLTKSKKYRNYCVAGIDFNTGTWIRLISEDNTIHNAVPLQDMKYENDKEAQILDIINVKIKKHSPKYYQPENYIYDADYYWKKVGQTDIGQVLKIVNQKKDNYIFYNDQKKLSQEFLESILGSNQYSLKLIVPKDVIIKSKRWNPNDNLSITACFRYKNVEYNYLKVTDESFNSKIDQEGEWPLNNVMFVLSLADVYVEDNCHYKLVASIINI